MIFFPECKLARYCSHSRVTTPKMQYQGVAWNMVLFGALRVRDDGKYAGFCYSLARCQSRQGGQASRGEALLVPVHSIIMCRIATCASPAKQHMRSMPHKAPSGAMRLMDTGMPCSGRSHVDYLAHADDSNTDVCSSRKYGPTRVTECAGLTEKQQVHGNAAVLTPTDLLCCRRLTGRSHRRCDSGASGAHALCGSLRQGDSAAVHPRACSGAPAGGGHRHPGAFLP
jgi:hypothetical protein